MTTTLEKAASAIMDRCEPSSHRWAEEVVCLVLKAIREPSDDVTDAMIDMLTERGCNPLSGDAEAVWQTGIDTILNTPTGAAN